MNEINILNFISEVADEILNDSAYLLAGGYATQEESEKRAFRLMAGLEYVVVKAVEKGYLSEVMAELAYASLNCRVEENISDENATLLG